MRGNELLDKMELIDSAYVEAADNKPKTKKKISIKWVSIAACLCLIITSITVIPRLQNSSSFKKLEPIEISEFLDSGMGFEGYSAYDISELTNANPWKENSKISTLPVYRNPMFQGENQPTPKPDFEKMRKLILDVADRLGLDKNDYTITDNAPNEETKQKIIEKFELLGETVPEGYFDPTELILTAEGIKIKADQTLTAIITFEPAVTIPKKYNFTHHASYNDKVAVAEYLKTTYNDLIGFKNSLVNVSGGDYNIYNQQSYFIEFFDGSRNQIKQLINYNFNKITFSCDDQGKLHLVTILQPDLSIKVGDYPIINSTKAKEKLLSGSYLTSVPYDISGKEYVKKVELIYRTVTWEEYYIPYYRFYVELPEEEAENGLKKYGAYYVPAITDEYIIKMPTYDGSFN